MLFVYQFHPDCDFGRFINFGLGTVRSERIKYFFHCQVQIDFSVDPNVENMLEKMNLRF